MRVGPQKSTRNQGFGATKGWKLKRTRQCEKCPWRVGVDPHEIPNGYSVAGHQALESTIAAPGDHGFGRRPMACHETEAAHCVGWLANQLGPGNNVALRVHLRTCENAGAITLRGEQHEAFRDTLPEE